ncbi:MAG: acyltransferase [Coriobacteriales bacterium]|jgi:peptidoglycan/LPS O-acetylase OafA/YrhL|nr:acyltransferase [Coriobacteriales bacterium]
MNLRWVSALRALGVVLVVVYHFFPSVLPGGFIGVDIFFVFSGYLICSLLLQEFERTDGLSLLRFYHRRIRRLLPAALFMVMATLPLLLLVSPDFRVSIGRQAAAVLGWCTNYYEIATGQSYENALLPHVFVHTWTLAVEMHFYLLWGAVALLGTAAVRVLVGKAVPARGPKDGERPSGTEGPVQAAGTERREKRLRLRRQKARLRAYRGFLGIVVLVLIVASYLDMRAVALASDDPSVAYFATTSHIFPLLIGAAAALVAGFSETSLIRLLQRLPFRAAVLLSAASLAAVVVCALTLSYASKATYVFGILLVALFVAFFLMLVRSMQPRLRDEPAPIRYVADRSYSIYLFHWPLYIVIEQLLTMNAVVAPGTFVGGAVVGTAALVATLAFSEVSYRLVEKPLRLRSARGAPASQRPDAEVVPPAASPAFPAAAPAAVSPLSPPAWVPARPQARPRPVAARAAVALVVVAVLGAFSGQALATAPQTSFIQQAYEHEVLFLNAGRLDETGARLASLDFQPLANAGAVGAVYPAEDAGPDASDPQGQQQEPQLERDPAHGSVEATYGSVTVIGDSVVMGGISALQEALGGGYIDTEGNRRAEQALPLLEQLEEDGLLGEYVVIGLSTNVFDPESLDGARRIAADIGPGHRLVFITGYGHKGVFALNDALWDLASEYPYVTVADWYSVASNDPELLSGDHIHIGGNEAACALYANCVVDAIKEASTKPTS